MEVWHTLPLELKAVLLLFVAGLLLLLIIAIPQWQAASWEGVAERKDLPKLENDARTTLIQALGGAALLLGIYFTAKTWRTTQEGQITDRFTKAINQLGEAGPEKLAIRLGGVYALERIARDSERDHWPIMEVLTAYIRENAPWKQENNLSSETQSTKNAQLPTKVATDIQAALTVLGRRTHGRRENGLLNLSKTDLRKADLTIADLEHVNLREAHLEGADLWDAHLQEADLVEVHLEGAYLVKTHLEGANLAEAHLERANLREAYLQGAYLGGACLEGAYLIETHLEGAEGLSAKQLSRALTLYRAHLDPALLEQIKQEYPQRLELPPGLKLLYGSH
jgi:uncharacterized protein YjbI with pentapeptide repeats